MAAIGAQRLKATFMENQPVAVPGGGKVDNYVPLYETYGRLRKKFGGRKVEGGQLVITATHEFECRWNGIINTVDKHTKVVVADKTFTLDSWYKVDEKNFYVRFELNEVT